MAQLRIAIVNYGGANSTALIDTLDLLGAHGVVTRDSEEIRGASHVILHCVGSAVDAMRKLRRDQMDEVIAGLKQPVLGIGLGMQLLARWSEEDDTDCLGIVPTNVTKLQISPQNPVPNSGWGTVHQTEYHRIFDGIADGGFFYFDHSYAIPVDDFTLATASHSQPFTAVLAQDNFIASQFYPEQSAESGSIFLAGFLRLRG